MYRDSAKKKPPLSTFATQSEMEADFMVQKGSPARLNNFKPV